MSEMFTKVHMVFENQHLLDRDKADFADILEMLGYDETRFEYHTDLNFVCLPGELVIIDEADCFMFKDPSAFKLFATEACCLCFTATPDNQDPNGIEARVITALEFKRFNYSQAGADVVNVSLEVDETVQCETLEEKAQFIKERVAQGPVHVYCDTPLTEQLKTTGCNPLIVTPATDYQVLRQLD
jgi:superfamily II DNA helicase RecQ